MLKQTTVNKTKQRTEKEKSNKAANKTVLASKKKEYMRLFDLYTHDCPDPSKRNFQKNSREMSFI